MTTLTITLHAISRWRERAAEAEQMPKATDQQIMVAIGRSLMRARNVRPADARDRVHKVLRHGALSTYHHDSAGRIVLVVSDGAVVSVYEYVKKRW